MRSRSLTFQAKALLFAHSSQTVVMAFKPLSSKEGFNAMAHLDADTIKFAMLLRNGGAEQEEDFMKGLSEEERKILEEENKRKRAEARQKPCAISSCKQVEASVAYCLIERVSIFKALEKARIALDENVDEYEALQTQSTAHTLEADALQQTLQALQHREKKELKEQLAALNKAKAQMEGAIAKAQQEMAELQQKASGVKEQHDGGAGMDPMGRSSGTHRSNLPDLNFLLQPPPIAPRVHTGSYCTIASGRKMWSCCLVEEEEAVGCSDDNSTRDKEHFVWKHREAYRPFTVTQAHWKAQHDDKLAALHAPVGLSSQLLRQSRQGGSRGWDGGGGSLENYFPARPLGGPLSPTLPSSQSAAAGRPSLKAAPSSSSPSNIGRPATVGSVTGRAATTGGRGNRSGGTFSPSVSFLLPGAGNPLGASMTSLQGGSPARSPSLTGRGYNGSLYSATSLLQPPPQNVALGASLIAPIASLLPPTNASVTTFGDTHDPPRLPCYVKESAVAPGWESSHTRSLDAGSFFYATDKAAGMTTNQRFQSSMRAAVHTPYARPASPSQTFGAGPPSPLRISPSPGKKGQIRVVRDASIKRIGGRPLTSYWGPHLSLSSTVSPSTDLENLSRRIV